MGWCMCLRGESFVDFSVDGDEADVVLGSPVTTH